MTFGLDSDLDIPLPLSETCSDTSLTSFQIDESTTSNTVESFSLCDFKSYMEEFNASLGAMIYRKISSIIEDIQACQPIDVNPN